MPMYASPVQLQWERRRCRVKGPPACIQLYPPSAIAARAAHQSARGFNDDEAVALRAGTDLELTPWFERDAGSIRQLP